MKTTKTLKLSINPFPNITLQRSIECIKTDYYINTFQEPTTIYKKAMAGFAYLLKMQYCRFI